MLIKVAAMYKRYMVFASDEYDNPDPFDCLALHTDNKSEALEFNDDSYLIVVFDRVKGVKIK